MFKYIRSSFRRELLYSLILVSILPLIISSYFMVRIFKQQIRAAEDKTVNAKISDIKLTLNDYFYKIDDIGKKINDEDDFISSLKSYNEDDFINLHQKLVVTSADLRRFAQFEIYDLNGLCILATNTGALDTYMDTYWGPLKEAQSKEGDFSLRVERDYLNDPLVSNVVMAKSLIDKDLEGVGYLVIRFRDNAFDLLLGEKYNLKDFIAILDSNFNTIYDTGIKYERPFADTLKERVIGGEDINQLLDEYSLSMSELEGNNIYLLLQKDSFFTSNVDTTILRIVGIMIILSFLLSTIASLTLSRNLFKPIHTISDAMGELEKGNLDSKIQIDRIDELGGLALSFNSMSENLKSHMDNRVKQEKELNESNIKMMQAQLNPHFIYNTLDTIKWVAKSKKVPEIVTLSTRLAKILRASISSNQLIELGEELNMVRNYMEIQQLRFDNKFTLKIDVNRDYYTYIIPKLSIQPLVENAVIHGLSDQDYGQIDISARVEGKKLFISVSDNGIGIDDNKLADINKRIKRDDLDGFGIFNIDKIIKLRYGEDYGLYLRKGDKGGIVSTIILPCIIGRGRS